MSLVWSYFSSIGIVICKISVIISEIAVVSQATLWQNTWHGLRPKTKTGLKKHEVVLWRPSKCSTRWQALLSCQVVILKPMWDKHMRIRDVQIILILWPQPALICVLVLKTGHAWEMPSNMMLMIWGHVLLHSCVPKSMLYIFHDMDLKCMISGRQLLTLAWFITLLHAGLLPCKWMYPHGHVMV